MANGCIQVYNYSSCVQMDHIMIANSSIKISVPIFAYNHEKYIAKALDSVLMQRTNFDYEIVIGDDFSTDNTRNILIDYKSRYPEKIRLLFNYRNLGAHRNIEQTLHACLGTYVAVLDGDDYWTSPDKLQRQADFLTDHPHCSLCFHDALILYEDGSQQPTSYRTCQKEFSTVEDLLLDNYIPTSSVMFRRGLVEKIPDWVGKLKMGDWPTYILYAQKGKIGYIDETMSVYVVHRGGVWSTKTWQDHTQAIIGLFEALDKHLEPKYTSNTRLILRWRYFEASEKYEHLGDMASARPFAVKAFAKHLLIVSEQLFYRKWTESTLIPKYMMSVKGMRLFNSLLRLYLVPVMRTHFPLPLYKFIGAIARKLDLGL